MTASAPALAVRPRDAPWPARAPGCAGTALRLRGAGAALPVPAHRRGRRLRVQRPEGPLQLHLGRLHPQELDPSLRRPGDRRRDQDQPGDRRALERRGHRAGRAHGGLARALPVPRAGAGEHADLPAHDDARRSCWAPRCSTLFLNQNIATGFATILIAHIMFNISYVVVTVKARLAGLRPSPGGGGDGPGRQRVDDVHEGDAAADRARRAGRGLLAFALSIDDFVITYFNSGSTITFPLFVWGSRAWPRRRRST